MEKRSRINLLDALRGLAIVGMVIYHFFWDLGYFGFIGLDVTLDPVWVGFARLLLTAFLFLAGYSLILAHGRAIRWRAFWRRFAQVAGAAIAISAATYWLFPDSFVFFGVLHAIALFSLMGLAFVRAPIWLVVAVIAGFFVLPLVWHADIFSQRYLAWIGFWREPPPTNDLVAIFPWFAVLLLGLLAARLVRGSKIEAMLARPKLDDPFGRGLQFLGRWSLVIYIVHQPLMLAMLYPLAILTGAGDQRRAEDFLASCQSQCLGVGNEAGYCTNYCGCALDVVEADQLWAAIQSPDPTPEQADALTVVMGQCQAVLPLGTDS